MSGRIDKPGGSSADASIYRLSQPASAQPGKQNAPQPEARSSYSFRDSRHVYKGGHAAVSLELAVEESAEQIELLGFAAGDSLRLDGQAQVSGSALIKTLTNSCLEVQFRLSVPEMSRRAAAMAFERLSDQPCQLDAEGLASLTSRVVKDDKGGYHYSLQDEHQAGKQLMAGPLDLRSDQFDARGSRHQVLTFMVASGNHISLTIELAPGQEPKGKLTVSVAPRIGEFDLSRQPGP